MAKIILTAAVVLLGASAANAAPPKIMPGEWQVVTTMAFKTMPNVPPKVAAAMKQHQGKPHTMFACITPEEAARGPETALADKNCSVRNASYANGRMSAESVCTDADGEKTSTRMSGTYSPTTYSMDGAVSSVGGGAGAMAMTMHMDGKRVAAVCSARSH